MASMEDCLKPILNHLSSELISQEALNETLKITRNLPQNLGYSMFGFEIRLENESPNTDFLVCASARCGGRQGLTDLVSSLNCVSPFNKDPIWGNIFDFIRQWNECSSSIYSKVDNIWLEFDSQYDNLFHITPSVFFEPLGEQKERDIQAGTVETCLKLLRPEKFSKRQMDSISNCFNKLPPDARIYQAGVMLSRAGNLTRLCIQNIPPVQLNDYLVNLGLDNHRDNKDNNRDNNRDNRDNSYRLLSVISGLTYVTDAIGIDLDLTDAIGETIGIECYCYSREKLQSLLDYITLLGLCTLEKRDALLKFPKVFDSVKNAAGWPENLRLITLLLGSNMISSFICSVDHIKIIYSPDQKLKAKAYLAVRHQWLTQCSLKED